MSWFGTHAELLAELTDFSALLFSAVLLAIYQVRLNRRIRKDPDATIHGLNLRARAAWVEHVMTEQRDIMAVQTLRNSTMAATLMASTAILMIFGILNLMSNSAHVGSLDIHVIDAMGSSNAALRSFKLLALLIDFLFAFFCFALAVRGFHHAGYAINVPLAKPSHGISPQKVIALLNRSASYYTLGMRSYYSAVPLVLWLFGPVWMVIATLILLVVLRHLDRLPQ